MVLTESVKRKIGEYIDWENCFDFSGWKKTDIFIDEKLSDSWIKARPEDAYKFENPIFKKYVDSANGKWLEKQYSKDKYKVIVASGLNDARTEDELCEIILHELRHCLDYQNAVKDLDFKDYYSGNQYYKNWSEYRAVTVSIRYNFFLKNRSDGKDLFKILAEILGSWSADCVEGLVQSKEPEEKLYFLSRYIVASRAIRNLSIKYLSDAQAFQLWLLTPTYITEKYGYVFYIANEWDNLKRCLLDAEPHTYYYRDLVAKLKNL